MADMMTERTSALLSTMRAYPGDQAMVACARKTRADLWVSLVRATDHLLTPCTLNALAPLWEWQNEVPDSSCPSSVAAVRGNAGALVPPHREAYSRFERPWISQTTIHSLHGPGDTFGQGETELVTIVRECPGLSLPQGNGCILKHWLMATSTC